MEELPHFESEVWSRFKDKGLVAVCIGREHSLGEIRRFREDKGFDVPMAPDPQRGIYGKFATKYIPRNYVVGRDGTIKYQSIGFDEKEFEQMIEVIKTIIANLNACGFSRCAAG